MNGRSGMLMAVAIVFGLGAMYGANRLLGRGPKTGEVRDVLTAAREVKVEEVLKPEMVRVVKMPVESVPTGSFANYKDVAERWVRMPLLAGEPIIDGKLAPKDAPLGLLARIPKGMRAFAIEVNEQSGVSGFVLPDHHVDVVLARTARGDRQDPKEPSETILQNVPVLAAGQVTTRPEDRSIQVRTMTLAVTPEQVDHLVAARTQGTLSLALRGNNDAAIIPIKQPTRIDSLPPAPVPAAIPDPPPRVVVTAPVVRPVRRSVLIFHGNRRVERIRIGPDEAAEGQTSRVVSPEDEEQGSPSTESRSSVERGIARRGIEAES